MRVCSRQNSLHFVKEADALHELAEPLRFHTLLLIAQDPNIPNSYLPQMRAWGLGGKEGEDPLLVSALPRAGVTLETEGPLPYHLPLAGSPPSLQPQPP